MTSQNNLLDINKSGNIGDSSDGTLSPQSNQRDFDNPLPQTPTEAKGCCARASMFIGYAA